MRGMKKWQPFKSLKGQFEMIDEMREEMKKEEMPVLSEYQIEDINRVLVDLRKDDVCTVKYFQDGHIQEKKLTFIRLDEILKWIQFKDLYISFSELISIKNENNFVQRA